MGGPPSRTGQQPKSSGARDGWPVGAARKMRSNSSGARINSADLRRSSVHQVEVSSKSATIALQEVLLTAGEDGGGVISSPEEAGTCRTDHFFPPKFARVTSIYFSAIVKR